MGRSGTFQTTLTERERELSGASVGTELMNLVDRPYDDHVMKLVFTMWMLLCQAVPHPLMTYVPVSNLWHA